MMLFRGAFMLKTGRCSPVNGPAARPWAVKPPARSWAWWAIGNIAKVTAGLAKALGMDVAAFDPFVPADDPAWANAERCEDLDSLLASCDAVSLHVPLNDSTRGLIDAAAISKMKKDAILLNAARGGVVDEKAMVEALKVRRTWPARPWTSTYQRTPGRPRRRRCSRTFPTWS